MFPKEALNKAVSGTKEERRYICSKSFPVFFAYYFPDYIKYPFGAFHYEMFEDIKGLMDGKYREVAWVMFRESAKTSIAKIFLIWLICHNKKRYINVDSFDKENSERVLFDIVVELQTNERLKADYGELFNAKRESDKATQKRISNFLTTNDVRVEAHSTQESVRGRIHGHQRPDFLLLDDFETNKTKDSKAYTEQVIKHIDEFKAGLDSTANIIYLGNYITEFGSIQSLMDRAKTDARLLIRSVPVIKDGIPTWPGKYAMTTADATKEGKVSLEDKKKQLGSQVFSAEMMNQPIDELTQEFPKKLFKYRTKEEVVLKTHRKFATIDSALTRNADSDFSGVTKNYVWENNDWNIDCKGYKINSKSLIDLIFILHEEGFEKIGIEEGAFTNAVEPFFQDECRKRNKFPYLIMLKHGGILKETRIRGLIPRYESGSIYHIQGECTDLEDQLLRFPKGIHDDCCFVAGTFVLTQRGQVPIEDLTTSDFAMTRSGLKEILNVSMTGEKIVITKFGLTGTPNHPVITTTGIKELQYAGASDILYIWNEKLSSIEETNTTDIQNLNGDNIVSISGRTPKIEPVYNLSVKDKNEYFANNILVHNCDSLAYQLKIAEPPYKVQEIEQDDELLYPDIGI